MKKIYFTLLFALVALNTMSQSAQNVLETARKANNYFMAKYAGPTIPTMVKKVRPSNLWTRGIYYEGLMALYGELKFLGR